MHKYINYGDSAVIGLISDLVDSKESTKFKAIRKYCKPKDKAEMLFFSAESSSVMKAQAIESATELNDKWNLYYVSLRIKTDTVYNRKEILKKNPNLARRALFGSEMRTEILNFLLSKKASFPSEIAKALGYRYHRVLEDIHNLLRDGALVERSFNKKKEIRLSQPFIDYLKSIPFRLSVSWEALFQIFVLSVRNTYLQVSLSGHTNALYSVFCGLSD